MKWESTTINLANVRDKSLKIHKTAQGWFLTLMISSNNVPIPLIGSIPDGLIAVNEKFEVTVCKKLNVYENLPV